MTNNSASTVQRWRKTAVSGWCGKLNAMIKEVTMFTVVCDNCGKDVNECEEYSCWNDKGFAQDIAMEADWIKEDDKHYCPDCFTYDDDDNLVIKEKSSSTDR